MQGPGSKFVKAGFQLDSFQPIIACRVPPAGTAKLENYRGTNVLICLATLLQIALHLHYSSTVRSINFRHRLKDWQSYSTSTLAAFQFTVPLCQRIFALAITTMNLSQSDMIRPRFDKLVKGGTLDIIR